EIDVECILRLVAGQDLARGQIEETPDSPSALHEEELDPTLDDRGRHGLEGVAAEALRTREPELLFRPRDLGLDFGLEHAARFHREPFEVELRGVHRDASLE